MTAARPMPRRYPTWVYGEGVEPDPRFSMANERTYLAWVRTALALIAGGVALEALGLPLQPQLRLAASILCLVLGLLVPPWAWSAWGRAERAMRRGEALPGTLLGPVLAVGVAVVASLVVVSMLLP